MASGSPIDTAYWKRVDALLEMALALPPRDRRLWLEQLGPEHDAHRTLLEQLLARSGVESDAFMGQPVAAELIEVASEGLHADAPGDLVGPYRLIALQGTGGMGTVWSAERADGSLRRRVALKLPRSGWFPGLAERLKRECDVLSTLEHPGIARLYDAGLAANGRPYLAMELIEGLPIDQYCHAHSLDVRERLVLFLQVAEAIAFAHARLVVHRDLKPANVLVDSAGAVHVVDFGVATILGEGVPPEGSLTMITGRALTPDYASPEQIRNAPITVASDVYSLGVVLYELLAGARPYKLRRDTPAALEEAILEADIEAASGKAPPERAKQLRGDLDTILAKALRKEARERYASVDAFAQDVRNHLEGRPVGARPLSAGYVLRKFVRRHRAVAAVGALLALAIAAGIAGTLWQARNARLEAERAAAERDRAVRELRFAESTEDFLRFLLSEQSARPVPTAELLRRSERAVADQYADDPTSRARILVLVADLLGEVQDYARAEVVLRQARAAIAGTDDPELLARIDCTIGGLLTATGRGAEALPVFEAATARLAAARASPESRGTLACHIQKAVSFRNLGKAEESLAESRAALAVMEGMGGGMQAERIYLKTEIANALTTQGKVAESLRLFEEAAEEFARLGRSGTSQGVIMANNLVFHLTRAGQLRRAENAYRRVSQAADAAELPGMSALQINYARLLLDSGRAAQVAAVVDPVIEQKARLGDHRGEAFGWLVASAAACELQELARCEALLAQAAERFRKVLPPSHSTFAVLEYVRGKAVSRAGRAEAAAKVLAAALAQFDAAKDRSPVRIRTLSELALAEQRSGRALEAATHAAAAVEAARQVTKGLAHSEWVGSALHAQALVLRDQGDRPSALAAAEEAQAHLVEAVGAGSVPVLHAEQLVQELRART